VVCRVVWFGRYYFRRRCFGWRHGRGGRKPLPHPIPLKIEFPTNSQTGGSDFNFTFTAGLAARRAIPRIAAERILAIITARGLRMPPVIVVDHGGPSPASAALRDELAGEIRRALGSAIGPLAATSMKGGEHPHAVDTLADALHASLTTLPAETLA
jgi:hypothetical protein